MNIVLYHPDIALNVGAIIRLCACFDAKLHIIEPCGFPFDKKKIKQSALDYIDKITIERHNSWPSFIKYYQYNNSNLNYSKLILLSTKAQQSYYDTTYNHNDYLIFGSESGGVSQEVWQDINLACKIPMNSQCRSLNLATSVAIVMGEFLRQTAPKTC